MPKLKSSFVCQSCGVSSPKWLGRCPDCGEWNSLVEEREEARPARAVTGIASAGKAQAYSEIVSDSTERRTTGLEELDRVLGGGLVPGSMVLLGGDPGIGKSTLLLQVAAHVGEEGGALSPTRRGWGPGAAGGKVLYVSGEESERQIKLRGERLGLGAPSVFLLSETSLEPTLEELRRIQPDLVIVDSVQTVYASRFASAPGSISQVRQVATELLYFAKSTGTPVFLIGHVTKDGNLAGPKALEHIVDTVLYFEGDRHHAHRIVRATKNRFGAAGELGVFEMTGAGLMPVANPSAVFLSERALEAPGSVVVCSVEGTRPLLLEIQALVSRGSFGYPRRVALGVDAQRVALLLAILEKRAGLSVSTEDVFVNVAGGLSVEEPAADLGVVAAVASSFRGRPVDPKTVLLGEVGLAGEVRALQQPSLRVREAARMGFTRALVPAGNLPLADAPAEIELVGVKTLGDALEQIF